MSATAIQTPKSAAPLLPVSGPPLDHNSATVNIPVSKIVRSPWNRRAVVDDEFIDSIRKNGVLQNVILRKIKATVAHATENAGKAPMPFAIGEEIYQLVAGERRWLGAKKAGQATVPAVIRTLSDSEAMELQILENEERESLNPMERCRAYARLVRQYQEDRRGAGDLKYSRKDAVKDVAERFSKEYRTVYQVIQLEDLAPDAKSALESGEITYSHGAVLCPRSEEEQAKLMSWLRTERDHSKGDLPSVRRLQRELEALDRENDEKRRQEKLFQEPSENASSPAVQTKAKGAVESFLERHPEAAAKPVQTPAPAIPGDLLYQDALRVVHEVGREVRKVSASLLQRRLQIKFDLADALLQRMENEGIVGAEYKDTAGKMRPYIFQIVPKPLVQTSAPGAAPIVKRPDPPKPPTPAQLKKQEEQRAKEQAEYERELRANERKSRIEKKFQIALFSAMVNKVQLNHRTLTRLIPQFLEDCWNDGDLSPEVFGPKLLGWPEPKAGNGEGRYHYEELREYAKKHTKKFTPGLLAALLLYLNTAPAETERLARYYAIDPKKLRKKAAAEVDGERVKLPAPPEDKRDRALYDYLANGWHGKEWGKLRKKGASDAAVRELLCRHFGEWGCTSGPNQVSLQRRGTSNNPRVWFSSKTTSASSKADLAGAELIAKVRQLLNIGE